jgi:hypothetical protein
MAPTALATRAPSGVASDTDTDRGPSRRQKQRLRHRSCRRRREPRPPASAPKPWLKTEVARRHRRWAARAEPLQRRAPRFRSSARRSEARAPHHWSASRRDCRHTTPRPTTIQRSRRSRLSLSSKPRESATPMAAPHVSANAQQARNTSCKLFDHGRSILHSMLHAESAQTDPSRHERRPPALGSTLAAPSPNGRGTSKRGQRGPHDIADDPASAGGQIGRYGLSWLEVFLEGDGRCRQFLLETPSRESDFRDNLW